MNSSLPLFLGALGLVGTGAALAAFSAPSPIPFRDLPIHTASMDHAINEQRGPRFSKEDRSAFFDARIAALHAGLTLTPDQEKLWPPLEMALRDNRKAMQDYWEARREQRDKSYSGQEPAPGTAKESGQQPLRDPVAMLKSRAEFEIMRGQHLKAIADAADPLYATLNGDQKKRVPLLMSFFQEPEHGPMPHHMAMDDGMRRGEHEPGGMRGWMRGHGPDEDGDGEDEGPRGGMQPPPRPHPGPRE